MKLAIEIVVGTVLLATGCATSSKPATYPGSAAAACDVQSTCQTDAAATRDREEYQRGAEEERSSAALMTILTTSQLH
ncbi:MAG: hypothetical protein ACLQBA_09755 [Candidatus Binataceae bacterium]